MKVYDIQWQQIEGHDVQTIANLDVAVLPMTGRRDAKHHVAFDLSTREELCQLQREEVRGWLVGRARALELAPTLEWRF